MNITKKNKYLPEQSQRHKNLSLLISSDLDSEGITKILSNDIHLVNKTDNKKETFFSYALQRKKIEVCKIILTNPTLDLSYKNNDGNSYLHIATESHCEQIIPELILKGISLNHQNNQGNTALHLAIINNDDSIKTLLLNSGADDSIKNNEGITPEEMLRDIMKDPFEDDRKMVDTRERMNASIKIDWSEDNINPKMCLSTLQDNEEEYAKSFIKKKEDCCVFFNNEKNNLVVLSTETRYNSGNNGENAENGNEIGHDDDDNEENNNNNRNAENNKDKNDIDEENDNNDTDKLNYLSDEDLFNLTQSFDDNDDINNNNLHKTEENKTKEDNGIKGTTIETEGEVGIKSNHHIEDEDLVNIKLSIRSNNPNTNITTNPTIITTNNNNNNNNTNEIIIIEPIDKPHNPNIPNSIGITNNIHQSNSSYQYQSNQNSYSFYNSNHNNKQTTQDKIPIDIETNFIFSAPNIDLQNHTSPSPASKPTDSIATTISNGNNNILQINTPQIVTSTDLYAFLSLIKMEHYANNLISTGFDDLKLIIEQTKSGIGITDANLREAGVDKPGDRAKILIKLQELANNFKFDIPKAVYHLCDNSVNCSNDPHIIKLNKWLTNLKIECYLNNFISNGYHSVELLQMQMESKQPITNEILLDEIHIDKLGYRARVLNKLKEEAKIWSNKLKSSTVIIEKKGKEELCDCCIF